MATAKALSEAKSERIWRAEEDARTLASAEDIMKDKKRLAGAKKQAKIMAQEQEKQLKSIRKVADAKQKQEK